MYEIRIFLNNMVKKHNINWKQITLNKRHHFSISVDGTIMRIIIDSQKHLSRYFWYCQPECMTSTCSGYSSENIEDIEKTIIEYLEAYRKKIKK